MDQSIKKTNHSFFKGEEEDIAREGFPEEVECLRIQVDTILLQHHFIPWGLEADIAFDILSFKTQMCHLLG